MIISYKNYFKESLQNKNTSYLSSDLIHDINDLMFDLKDSEFNYLIRYYYNENIPSGVWINANDFTGDIKCIKSISLIFNCVKHYDDAEDRKIELTNILKDTIPRIYNVADKYSNTSYNMFHYINSQVEIDYKLIKSIGVSNILNRLLGNDMATKTLNSKISICVFVTN